jgi:hypothetical protein
MAGDMNSENYGDAIKGDNDYNGRKKEKEKVQYDYVMEEESWAPKKSNGERSSMNKEGTVELGDEERRQNMGDFNMVDSHLMHPQCDDGIYMGKNINENGQNSNEGNNVFPAKVVAEQVKNNIEEVTCRMVSGLKAQENQSAVLG